MATTLCFDFGNTRKKMAVFHGAELKEVLTLPDDSEEIIRHLLSRYQPAKTILSSVIDHNPLLEEWLTAVSKFHTLSHQTKVAFSTPVGKPETIGADRLALASFGILDGGKVVQRVGIAGLDGQGTLDMPPGLAIPAGLHEHISQVVLGPRLVRRLGCGVRVERDAVRVHRRPQGGGAAEREHDREGDDEAGRLHE